MHTVHCSVTYVAFGPARIQNLKGPSAKGTFLSVYELPKKRKIRKESGPKPHGGKD